MTTYSRGKVIVVNFPYTDGGSSKRRPALVVFDSGDNDVVVARLTTQKGRGAWDVELSDWVNAGLRAPTTARLDKLLTIEKSDVRHEWGALSGPDYQRVGAVLNTMFGSW
jgi:mRNA-degrading endonuclease toxin of MazEF toxin-antitoxin module